MTHCYLHEVKNSYEVNLNKALKLLLHLSTRGSNNKKYYC